MVIRERQSHSLISGIDYFDAMLLSMSCDEKIPKLLLPTCLGSPFVSE